jgi:hypothetical protein
MKERTPHFHCCAEERDSVKLLERARENEICGRIGTIYWKLLT